MNKNKLDTKQRIKLKEKLKEALCKYELTLIDLKEIFKEVFEEKLFYEENQLTQMLFKATTPSKPIKYQEFTSAIGDKDIFSITLYITLPEIRKLEFSKEKIKGYLLDNVMRDAIPRMIHHLDDKLDLT